MKQITRDSIKAFRESKGMTQREFAKYMDVTVHAVRTWERSTGGRIPKRFLTDIRTHHLATEV
jgi:DNA-binding transcriptional regulator YiaG